MDPKNLVGTKLDNRYEVSRVIGAGGMGAVYEAHHSGTRRRVAVKVISTGDLSKDEQLVGRFQREAKAAGAVDTQHICQVLDTGVDANTGWPFMVMEFMAGEDVQQLLRRVGPVHADLALRIAAQSCMGLQKAHDAGVVHRDIKPANLYLAKSDAGTIIVKLLDFGIAKVKMEHASEMGDAGLTRTGTMLGSPLYMSPEQARGVKAIDHRADVWSLGVVLYEMLTGRTPFHHLEALGELIIAICSEPPRPVQDFAPWVTPEVAAVVHKALKVHASERYQSASEMLQAIKAIQTEWTIDDAQLVSLSETHRNIVARRLTLPPPGLEMNRVSNINVPAQSIPPPAMTQEVGGTTGGIAAPTERQPGRQKSNVGLIVGGAVLSIAILGGLAFKFVSDQRSASAGTQQPVPTTEVTTLASAVSTGVTAVPVGSMTVNPTGGESRTLRLVVIPEDATVTVNGKAAKVTSDGAEITGSAGDEYTVVVKKDGREIEQLVVIGAKGLVPSKVVLDMKAPAGTKQTGTPPPKSTAPAGAATTAKPAATPTGVETEFK